MSERKPRPARRETPPTLPVMPSEAEAEKAINRDLIARLEAATARLHQRNLANAATLAQMAASGRLTAMGQGQLADHFAELGRRFSELLDQPPPRRRLRVVQGGAS